MTNSWHIVNVGEDAPTVVNSIIEIPKESRAKYELCKETGLLKLDRVLYSPFHYPANYGFIPQTLGLDNDPMDILVFSQIRLAPLCKVRSKIIGVMHMVDNGEIDDKILAVAADDIGFAHYKELQDLPKALLEELKHFFEEYKALENKRTSVQEFGNSHVAYKIIRESINRYQKAYPKN